MKLGSLVSAIGVAMVLSAFGYVSLRAHWNHLGIAAPAGVGAERYAQETYQIVLSSVEWLAIASLAAAMPIALARVAWRGFARRTPQRAEALSRRLRVGGPLLVLITLVAIQVAVLRITSPAAAASDPNVQCSSDIALGALREKAVAGCYAERQGELTYVITLVATIAAFVLTAGDERTALQKLVWLAALALALQLPIIYGYAVKPPLYRVVRITAADRQLVGVLVLQTSDALELWDATNAIGRMIVVAPRDVKTMESGAAVDIEQVIRIIAADPAPGRFQHFCDATLSAGGQ